MALSDLREYIARLEQEGEIQRITAEIQPVLEVGAIIRRSYELRAPAPLFLNLRGYPGHRILGAPIGLSSNKDRTFARIAISMDMPPDSSPLEIIDEYLRRIAKPVKPVLVEHGPCKQNILLGDAIDLQAFPAPVLHRDDGGPYLGWHTNISKDPDTAVQNWRVHRILLHDKKTMGGPFPGENAGVNCYMKYESRGRSMEFAIAIGSDPVTPWAAGTGSSPAVSEADIIGAIRGAPLELVKCETVDLAVPATSEIVIEGFVPPYERKDEGPFGESSGLLALARAPQPVYHVTAITHRDDPILPVICAGAPVDDTGVALSLTKSSNILAESRRQGFPVRAVYSPPEALSYWTVIATKVPNADYVRRLAQTIWKNSWGRSSWCLVIVEENVDPTDMGQVLWAISTMCHPKRWVVRPENFAGHPMLSQASEEDSKHVGPYALFDCTWPRDWSKVIPLKTSFDDIWPREVQEKVLRSWSDYGYRKEGAD